MIQKIKNCVKNIFSIDFRALAVFRICIALILIFDLIVRSFALIAHYTDYGVLPLDFYFNIYSNTEWISLHLLSGSILFQSILFVIAGLFAFMLLIGYHTRLATIVSWFLLISLQSRNPTVLQGGDIMLRVLMFWAMFLPLNKIYSIDFKLGKVKNKDKNILSFGTAGILLQVAFVYFFSALLKTGNEWKPDGTAIYYSLQADQFTTHFGKFLLGFPDLLVSMTLFVYFLELIGPVLLFCPLFFKQVRTTTTFAFLLTLIGMALSLNLGHFPFVGITGMLLFLPSWFWDKIFTGENYIHKYKNSEHIFFENKRHRIKKYFFIFINLLAFFFIIYILFWNIQSLEKFNAVPDKMHFISYKFRIDQYWNMFSPYPLKDDGWYVIDGALANGLHVDLLTKNEVNFDKPEHVANLYVHERWRKYLMNLWQSDYSHHRSYYLNYLCDVWNEDNTGNQKMQNITMNFMLEMTQPDYELSNIEKVVLEERACN